MNIHAPVVPTEFERLQLIVRGRLTGARSIHDRGETFACVGLHGTAQGVAFRFTAPSGREFDLLIVPHMEPAPPAAMQEDHGDCA